MLILKLLIIRRLPKRARAGTVLLGKNDGPANNYFNQFEIIVRLRG
jgi:hypothetical protein